MHMATIFAFGAGVALILMLLGVLFMMVWKSLRAGRKRFSVKEHRNKRTEIS